MPSDKDFHFCETYSASVLYYTDNAFEFVKIGVTYDCILKTDARVELKNEIYLTQMSMLMEVYSCYSYKRHI